MKIGRKLGADVPYCIAGGFARVRGMGEKITPLGEGERFPLVLLHVGRGLSTAQVFPNTTAWEGHWALTTLPSPGPSSPAIWTAWTAFAATRWKRPPYR